MAESRMTDTPWTVLRLLEWTTTFFKSRGSESPRLDAEILLAHARGCQRIDLYTAFGDVPGEEQRIAFREMVKRRGDGAPVAQLVGFREFYSIPIRVDENVLVPRPETEHVVIEAIDVLKALAAAEPSPIAGRPVRVLDVGTGSGAIAVAIAKNVTGSEVVAVDTSLPALEIARWNVEQLGLTDRVELVHSDLFEAVAGQVFDVICSNPPYITAQEYDDLPRTVRDFEPKSALLAGPAGTEVIRRILDSAAAHLHPHGRLIIELSPMIAPAVDQMVRQQDAWAKPKWIKDLAGLQRVVSIAKASPA